ncbi:hypothetical protein Brsp06_03480 [Brucella sp. NBRC 13694]|uniref:hypothetical protein n=1 Tax=Brucella sp. NBRC 13694 TaxID=3075482 RepID=UPI0030B34F22
MKLIIRRSIQAQIEQLRRKIEPQYFDMLKLAIEYNPKELNQLLEPMGTGPYNWEQVVWELHDGACTTYVREGRLPNFAVLWMDAWYAGIPYWKFLGVAEFGENSRLYQRYTTQKRAKGRPRKHKYLLPN